MYGNERLICLQVDSEPSVPNSTGCDKGEIYRLLQQAPTCHVWYLECRTIFLKAAY